MGIERRSPVPEMGLHVAPTDRELKSNEIAARTSDEENEALRQAAMGNTEALKAYDAKMKLEANKQQAPGSEEKTEDRMVA